MICLSYEIPRNQRFVSLKISILRENKLIEQTGRGTRYTGNYESSRSRPFSTTNIHKKAPHTCFLSKTMRALNVSYPPLAGNEKWSFVKTRFMRFTAAYLIYQRGRKWPTVREVPLPVEAFSPKHQRFLPKGSLTEP